MSQSLPCADDFPVVSVIIPCRNERDHIEACVHSILDQDPPKGGFEVIVADGMSNDGTREILQRLAENDVRLQLVDNPTGTTPCGMNAGIRKARGQYIAIFGAHCKYAPDYIRKCLELLDEHPEVCCSGGPIVSRGRGLFGRAVAAAMSHPLGVGNAKHRFPNYEGYAEGACFPVFRREVFDNIGPYDENLPRNQDDELNYRIALHGGKIFISPRAQCVYYVREKPSQVFWQYFQYGYWRVAVLRKHHVPASMRQLIPIVFFFLMVLLLLIGLCLPGWWALIAAVIPLVYASTLLLVGAQITVKRRDAFIGPMFTLAVAVMHLAYALGFGWNMLRSKRSWINQRFLYQGG